MNIRIFLAFLSGFVIGCFTLLDFALIVKFDLFKDDPEDNEFFENYERKNKK